MTLEQVWVNGEPRSHIDVRDRAVHYGDGLFETIRVARGRCRHLARHLARLRTGCERLGISGLCQDTLKREIGELASRCDSGVLKVLVSRGGGTRGYRIDASQLPTRILALSALPERRTDIERTGIRVRLCRTRLAVQPALAGIKHLNRLEQVLARAEWDDPAIGEGLMQDGEGHVIEGTMSNLFIVLGGELLTPDLSGCGVAGVMRSVILDCAARLGIARRIRSLTLDDMRSADEVFVCNSLIGIWPVTVIDGINRCETGEVTRKLLAAPELDAESDNDTWYPS